MIIILVLAPHVPISAHNGVESTTCSYKAAYSKPQNCLTWPFDGTMWRCRCLRHNPPARQLKPLKPMSDAARVNQLRTP